MGGGDDRVRETRFACELPLEWWAGIEHLLVAVRRAVDSGARLRLTLTEDGPELERIRFAVHDLELVDLVHHGLDPAAACTLVPVIWSGHRLRELPRGAVIASDVAPIRRLGAGRADLTLVPPRDTAALADAIVAFTGSVDR